MNLVKTLSEIVDNNLLKLESKLFLSENLEIKENINDLIVKLITEIKNGNSYLEVNNIQIKQLQKLEKIISDNKMTPLVLIDNKLFIGKIWYMEKQIATLLIKKIKNNTILFITGGPGTGKTYKGSEIITRKIAENKLIKIAITAPTGKAAANLAFKIKERVKNNSHTNEIVGQTIHKLLKINHITNESPFSNQNTIDYDLIIIDECSMLDLNLLLKLLNATKEKTELIFLGDENQLPPINSANILSSLKETKLLNESHTHLTKTYRFDDSSGIYQVSTMLNKKQIDPNKIIHLFNNFNDISIQNLISINNLIKDWYLLTKEYWNVVIHKNKNNIFEQLENFIMLTALNHDAEIINELCIKYIREEMNYNDKDKIFPGIPIIITSNDYYLNIFNGDIGVIVKENNTLKVIFYNKEESIILNHIQNYKYAFAITTHKSQGSEFDNVWFIAPMKESDNNNLVFNKKMLYTAITRAKKSFKYIGTIDSIKNAINNLEDKKTAISFFINQLEKNQE